jgi:hypothetical protein
VSVQREALDLSLDDHAISRIIQFFQLLDSWDRDGIHGN